MKTPDLVVVVFGSRIPLQTCRNIYRESTSVLKTKVGVIFRNYVKKLLWKYDEGRRFAVDILMNNVQKTSATYVHRNIPMVLL